jgi:crossover junction endodeoxyribonuclease RuvC
MRKMIARKQPRQTTTILGIDPGLDRTGYAVIEVSSREKYRVIDAGIIRSSSRDPLAARLSEIEAAMCDVLTEHGVSLVAVEDLYAHYQHPRTAILMGHARGVVLLTAARRTIPVLSFPATNVKKMLTGNGHAGKMQIQRAIVSTFGLRKLPEPPDVADAMAIAWCAGMCRA